MVPLVFVSAVHVCLQPLLRGFWTQLGFGFASHDFKVINVYKETLLWLLLPCVYVTGLDTNALRFLTSSTGCKLAHLICVLNYILLGYSLNVSQIE